MKGLLVLITMFLSSSLAQAASASRPETRAYWNRTLLWQRVDREQERAALGSPEEQKKAAEELQRIQREVIPFFDRCDQCEEVIQKNDREPNAELSKLRDKVAAQKCVKAEDEAELKTINSIARDQFISKCSGLTKRPLCNNADRTTLKRLIDGVATKQRVEPADQKMLSEIIETLEQRQDVDTFIYACEKAHRKAGCPPVVQGQFERLIESAKKEGAANWKALDEIQANLNRASETHANDNRAPNNDNRVSHNGKALLWKIAPIVLAFGQGLLNNWLARNVGDLKQVAFYRAPGREWATGTIAWILFLLLQIKAPSSHPIALMLGAGIAQHIGERLPLGGTSWRAPVNPAGSIITNVLLANSSLFASGLGAVGFGLSKILG